MVLIISPVVQIGQPEGAAPSAQSLEKVKAIAPRYGVIILTGD
jgi:hypothetical protein